MGSEFSYADITPPRVEDFKHTLIKEETADGESCWVIESVPKNDDIADENGYSKKVSHIAKKDYVIRKALYFDLSGDKHKELIASAIQEIDPAKKRFRATSMVMTNLQNNRKSTLKIEQIKFSPDIKDDYFTTRYLEKE